MYIVTFYSFKGGVGRSMALVNVAVELACQGRSVLVVDFDLEAPGIPTFNIFDRATNRKGMVDYIADYVATREAPDVKDYIYSCEECPSPITGKLWVMPAGSHDPGYSAKLNSIDWQKLYAEQDGYLLFEDMKAQWVSAINPDYVLIDSRTGHTDVGGICTRQLPDAVVLMFFPNQQNLAGLSKIADDIRGEETSPRKKKIKRHFVLSNIPDMDDEDGILSSLTNKAKQILNFQTPSAAIHHYNSLALLNQIVFTKDRPRSRLAQEYRQLKDEIIAGNLRDRDGAIAILNNMQLSFSGPNRDKDIPIVEVETELSTIASAHQQDGEILSRVARIWQRLGEYDNSIAMLTAAMAAGIKNAEILIRRGTDYHITSHSDEATADLLSAISMDSVDITLMLRAVRGLVQLSPSSLSDLDKFSSFQGLDLSGKLRIIDELRNNKILEPTIESILRDLLTDPRYQDADDKGRIFTQLVLYLIFKRKFREALGAFGPNRLDPQQIESIGDCFNYSVAEWGLTNKPPIALFRRVLELHRQNSNPRAGANYQQCLAIASFVVGEFDAARAYVNEARKRLRTDPRPDFSAWRYAKVSPSVFENDLDALSRLIDGKFERPLFLPPTF